MVLQTERSPLARCAKTSSGRFSVAAGFLYLAFDVLLRPEIAALSMAGSSLLVAINALLLKRTRLPGIHATHPGEQIAQAESVPTTA